MMAPGKLAAVVSAVVTAATLSLSCSKPSAGDNPGGGIADGAGTEDVSDTLAACSFSQDIGQALTADMLYQPVGLTTKTLQCFDIDRKGNCFLSWDGTDRMMVRRYYGEKYEQMTLPSSGHGDCLCVEQTSDDGFFWTSGTLGDLPGGYSGAKADDAGVHLICRFRFEADSNKYAENAEECFFLNTNGCRIVSLDEEHDAFGCWTYADGKEWVIIYRYSEMRTAAKALYQVTREKNKWTPVEVYNLNSIEPLAKFSWNRMDVCGEKDGGPRAVQGFCIYDGHVYVEAGSKSDAWSTLSVLDFKGNMLTRQAKVGVSSDKAALVSLNLTEDGNFEPEGVQIHGGRMFLGFSGDFPSTSSAKKHSCIIRLK